MSEINLATDIFSVEEAATILSISTRTVQAKFQELESVDNNSRFMRKIGNSIVLTRRGIELIRENTYPVGRPWHKNHAKQ